MDIGIKKEQLLGIATQQFGHLYNRFGEGIYSSHETLREGDVYLLGLNPGGEGHTLLGDFMSKTLTRTDNSYLDEIWVNGQSSKYKKGSAPLQKRIQGLLEGLNQNVADVCASNLIFTTSKSSQDSNFNFGFAGTFWPFHQAVIEIVKPKVIITFGNAKHLSPFGFLKSMYLDECNLDSFQAIPAEHGTWECYGFKTMFNGRETAIIGLPHLSYFNPNKEAILEWIKKFSGL
ncbi:hypothetical protein H5085_10530 [Pseudoalteromonas sp. SR43-6]|jgi:hypothetical protein|uniref:hypothetical protein n=1 Tax=unclassified Pseudoalteromonas TaxID=194690 RepID=UPI0015FDF810|nr:MULTISPECIES: hypothetical protein [unclassified Pseudoalteromonas]MBB1288832.1 hypothetical protein [Pseudoalteromonas sp. SR41-5]MBB1330875.1 hypothetical protein [Pseudoalteromonas sp. SR43-7]MBB1374755.1 hypothetical protein [Pseudoalteromonas sp. SR43-6]MBB1413869.1 hypothetical protein [Pseudoalteromonas sp. SG43-8]